MTLQAFTAAGLEIRAEGGAVTVSARFPYGAVTELAPGRFEVIASRAFADRINGGGDIHLLVGHDYGKPLASRASGNLRLTDTDAGLTREARIDAGTTWAADFLAAHRAGLITGLSPGFVVPAGGERIERRGAGILRTITRASLHEVSAVTVPAYGEAAIEARNWTLSPLEPVARMPIPGSVLRRWRH